MSNTNTSTIRKTSNTNSFSNKSSTICYQGLVGFLLLLTVLAFISCDSVDPNNPEFKFYSVSGNVLDYVDDGSPYLKEGAPVVLDGDTSISNTEGIYSFNKVIRGKHIISVSMPGYEYFADTIFIYSDTLINIPLYGIKEDYFPIEVNTQKSFEYHSGGYGIFGWSDSGEATWDIYSSIQQGDNIVYNVKETLIYVRTTTLGDTLPPVTVITNFKFIEDEFHIITIQNSTWNGMSFDRYLDPRRGDIIMFGTIPGHSIYLKRNVGIWKLHYEEWLHLSGITYQLIE